MSSPTYPPSRPPSPPTITHHPSPTLLPKGIPPAGLVNSVAGAAHYSSVRRTSEGERARASFGRGISDEGLSAGRKRVLADMKELFCSRPTIEILERTWSPNAVFEDPLSKCIGFKEYAPQWFAMPKVFPQSETLSSRVLSSTTSPNRLVYSQTQQYTVRFLRTKKVIQSLVVIDLDDDDKIVKLEDKWNGEDQPTRWGAHALRRLNAKALPWFVQVKAPREKFH